MSTQFEFMDAGRTITLVPQGDTVEAVWSQQTCTGITGIAAQAIKALLAKIAELTESVQSSESANRVQDGVIESLQNKIAALESAEPAWTPPDEDAFKAEVYAAHDRASERVCVEPLAGLGSKWYDHCEVFARILCAPRQAEIARLTAELGTWRAGAERNGRYELQYVNEREEIKKIVGNPENYDGPDAPLTLLDMCRKLKQRAERAEAALAEHRNELVGLADQTEAEIFAESTAKELAGHITAYIQQQNGEIHDLETERDELTHRLAAYETRCACLSADVAKRERDAFVAGAQWRYNCFTQPNMRAGIYMDEAGRRYPDAPQPEQRADESVRTQPTDEQLIETWNSNRGGFLRLPAHYNEWTGEALAIMRAVLALGQQPRRVSRDELRELEFTCFNPNWRGGTLRDALAAVLRELGIDVETDND